MLCVPCQFTVLSSKHSDTRRTCKLTLKIDHLDEFLAAKAEVKGQLVGLSDFKWCLTAQPDDDDLVASIECHSDAERWHCKAEYVIRLNSTKNAPGGVEARNIFDVDLNVRRFSGIVTLSVSDPLANGTPSCPGAFRYGTDAHSNEMTNSDFKNTLANGCPPPCHFSGVLRFPQENVFFGPQQSIIAWGELRNNISPKNLPTSAKKQ